MKRFIYSQYVTAHQLDEEDFTADHPSERHLLGVVYDPNERTARVPEGPGLSTLFDRGAMTAHIGDWIVLIGGTYRVMSDAFFRECCSEVPG